MPTLSARPLCLGCRQGEVSDLPQTYAPPPLYSVRGTPARPDSPPPFMTEIRRSTRSLTAA